MAKLFPNPNYEVVRDSADELFGILMRQIEVAVNPSSMPIVHSFILNDIAVLDNLEFQLTSATRDMRIIYLRRPETSQMFEWSSPGNLWYLDRLHEYEIGPAPYVKFNDAGWGITSDYKQVVFRDAIGIGLVGTSVKDILDAGMVDALWANNELIWHKIRPYKRPYPKLEIKPKPIAKLSSYSMGRINKSLGFLSAQDSKPVQSPKPKLRAISLDDE